MTTMTAQPTGVQQQAAQSDEPMVFAGVDTHSATHTVAVVDALGGQLDIAQFDATQAGHTALEEFIQSHGHLGRVGVEGSSCYGLNLTAHLQAHQVPVLEITRPDRSTRRCRGKSDPLDALAAARAAITAGPGTSTPKDHHGPVEALRVLRVDRAHAVKARADATRVIKSLIITAPIELREQLQGLSTAALITACARLRPDPTRMHEPVQATKRSLRDLARRHRNLSEDIAELDTLLADLVATINPALTDLPGVGVETAGQLLVTAGGNPDRLHSEAAFAALCGVAPIPASSGNTHRHRLSRGGDRQANRAIHMIALTRLRWDPRTRDYLQRRTTEGKTRREITRCLKRYIARQIHHALTHHTTT